MIQTNNLKSDKFTPPHRLSTAVLFLVFNRLDTTKQVFEAIRQAKPPRLYVAADGARQSKEGEEEKVNAVRDFIMSSIDWNCEVKTLFREQNYGCKMAVSGAIAWFFANEEMGIILEDDCLPSQSFFWFCEELLERYENDMRVWHIGGSNFQNGIKRGDGDYYFSKYNLVWGWASWANRWKKCDIELDSINDTKFLKKTFKDKNTVKYWTKLFNDMKAKKINTWDYQYTFSMWDNDGLAILPNSNMISNIGFGVDATHTIKEGELSNIYRSELFLTKYPSEIVWSSAADHHIFYAYFNQKSFLSKIKNKIKKLIQ